MHALTALFEIGHQEAELLELLERSTALLRTVHRGQVFAALKTHVRKLAVEALANET